MLLGEAEWIGDGLRARLYITFVLQSFYRKSMGGYF